MYVQYVYTMIHVYSNILVQQTNTKKYVTGFAKTRYNDAITEIQFID